MDVIIKIVKDTIKKLFKSQSIFFLLLSLFQKNLTTKTMKVDIIILGI